eukprot:s1922_g3.t1
MDGVGVSSLVDVLMASKALAIEPRSWEAGLYKPLSAFGYCLLPTQHLASCEQLRVVLRLARRIEPTPRPMASRRASFGEDVQAAQAAQARMRASPQRRASDELAARSTGAQLQ